jgi:hypothetical protein
MVLEYQILTGTISSTVSANTTSGFSIVSYTGTGAVGDIGHGLGSTPKMIIKKRRDGVDAWNVWHESLGDGSKALYLNTTNATDTNANYASNVPTSSLFYVGTDSQINASGGTYIAYCFADVKGLASLVHTQVMVLLMVRLCTRDLNLRLF